MQRTRIDIILQKLYESEIDCAVESEWDNGWNVRLGKNPVAADTNVRTLYDAAIWLHEQALKHFPDSDYAKAASS